MLRKTDLEKWGCAVSFRARRKCEILETGLFVANPLRSAKREFGVRACVEEPISWILITLSDSYTFQRANKRVVRTLFNVWEKGPLAYFSKCGRLRNSNFEIRNPISEIQNSKFVVRISKSENRIRTSITRKSISET